MRPRGLPRPHKLVIPGAHGGLDCRRSEVESAGEDVLEVYGRYLCLQYSAVCHRYASCLLADHHAVSVCGLAHSQCGAVAQSQLFGYIHIMAHGEYASRGRYTAFGNYHGAVVQGGVLEENILYKTHVYVGVYHVACLLITVERHLLLYDYQCAGPGARHAVAGIDHGKGLGMVISIVFLVAEEAAYGPPFVLGSYVDEKSLYLVLEQYHQHYESDAHEFVEDCAGETHAEDFGCHYPYKYESEHTVEKAEGAAGAHHAVEIEEHECHYQYVDDVFYAEIKHVREVGW